MRRIACLAFIVLFNTRELGGPALPEFATESGATASPEISELQAALDAKSAEVERLRAENDKFRTCMNSVAMPIRFMPASKGFPNTMAPSSGLSRDSAGRAAMAARLMVSGGGALNVLPTGSMRPTFDQNAILLTEPAHFEDIRVGDIVTFKHPSYPVPVVHRVLGKRGERLWSKGDANGRMDDVYITRENSDRRVFGIIYGREPAATPVAR